MSSVPAPAPLSVPPPPAQRRRRVWPWILLACVLMVAVCGGLLSRVFFSGLSYAHDVAAAQLPVVSQITSTWDMDALYRVAGAELKQSDAVGRAYFADWSKLLGPSQSLKVAGFFIRTHNDTTFVTGSYDGQFAHGTARVVVQFAQSGNTWQIHGFNVTNIVPSGAATASTAPASSSATGPTTAP